MERRRGAGTAPDAGTRWFRGDPAPWQRFLHVQVEVPGRRRVRGNVAREIESQVLPVIVDVVEDDDLAVADDGHATSRGRVVRLIVYAVLWQPIFHVCNTFRYIVLYIIAIQYRVVGDDVVAPIAPGRVVIQDGLGWVSSHRVHLG